MNRKPRDLDAPIPQVLLDSLTDPRPHIPLSRPIHEVEADLITALELANDPEPAIFQRGRRLVRVVESHTGGPAVSQIDILTSDSLRSYMTRAARTTRYSSRLECDIPADPTRDHLAAVLTAREWPFPVLAGISEVPVVRPDGTLHDRPGYDPATHLIYHPAPDLRLPPIPDCPTLDDLTEARTFLLDDLLIDFPFAADGERANAMALLLLPFVRALIDGPTPLHLVESPTAGTGKGLLVQSLLIPAFGHRLAPDPEKTDDEATSKWITSKAAAGSPVCWIDNLRHGLDNAVLANALTATRWSDRLLGGNELLETDLRPVWVATANNPVLTEELIRRTVRIRLDANTDRPSLRTGFRHPNQRAWVQTHRGDLIVAALTLVRAWIVAGRPAGTQKLGSYESYTEVIGGILDVAGVEGFLANLTELYEVADPDSAQWAALIEKWADKYGYQETSTSDVYLLAAQEPSFDLGNSGTDRGQRTKFGAILTKQRDKIYGGLKVTFTRRIHNAAHWKLVPIRPMPVPAEGADPLVVLTY